MCTFFGPLSFCFVLFRCVNFCFILFYYSNLLEASLFLLTDRERVDLDGEEDGEEMGGVKGREIVIRIY